MRTGITGSRSMNLTDGCEKWPIYCVVVVYGILNIPDVCLRFHDATTPYILAFFRSHPSLVLKKFSFLRTRKSKNYQFDI